jgi:hypothetical protein
MMTTAGSREGKRVWELSWKNYSRFLIGLQTGFGNRKEGCLALLRRGGFGNPCLTRFACSLARSLASCGIFSITP